jgi:hypothetical protein
MPARSAILKTPIPAAVRLDEHRFDQAEGSLLAAEASGPGAATASAA